MYKLSALPSSTTKMEIDTIQTFVIRINAYFMPSESTILTAMRKDIDNYGLVETLDVTRALFSNDFNIVFKIKKPIEYGKLANIVKSVFTIGMGYEAAIVDVKSEFYSAPSAYAAITAPITKITEAAGAIPKITSNITIIAVAVLGIAGLVYLSPYLPKSKKS